MKIYAIRLHPGQDLRKEVDNFVQSKNIKAGAILTCVGSLQKAVIRMANPKIIKTFKKDFEIVSLVGTVEAGNSHLHISLSDATGQIIGGHLKEGSIISTTAEIVIGEFENLAFKRLFDQKTGFDELIVEKGQE